MMWLTPAFSTLEPLQDICFSDTSLCGSKLDREAKFKRKPIDRSLTRHVSANLLQQLWVWDGPWKMPQAGIRKAELLIHVLTSHSEWIVLASGFWFGRGNHRQATAWGLSIRTMAVRSLAFSVKGGGGMGWVLSATPQVHWSHCKGGTSCQTW